jgi:streptogramin lyase
MTISHFRCRFITRYPIVAATAVLSTLLAGCGIATTTAVTATQSTPVTAVQTVSGMLFGGQQPISGSSIQLYAVGNQGLQSTSTPLVSQTVLTGNDGSFNITGLWDCNNTALYGTDPLLYLVATGGNPSLGGSGTNSAIALMAALGPCSTKANYAHVTINEVTTVASVYALAPFMADYLHIGAPSSGMGGLTSAFQTVHTLADTTTGVSPGPAAVAGETVPSQLIYALSNSIASCINSSNGPQCAALFSATAPSSGSRATDTIAALLQVAQSPAHNVSGIFNVAASSPPFQPALSFPPADWTIALRFTGGGLASPAGLALDASGNVWVANSGGASITGLGNQGAPLTGAQGYSANGTLFGAQAVTVDKTGNVWIADTLLSSVVKLSVANGTIQGSSTYTSAINGPTGIAADSQNNIWVANFGDGSVTELDTNGTPLVGSPFTAGGTLQAPFAVAIDAFGHAWVTDNAASLLIEFDTTQALLSGSGFSDQAMLAPTGLAISPKGQVWLADNGNNAVSLFGPTGTSQFAAPVTGAGLTLPNAIAIDGNGVAWVASTSGTGLTQVTQGGTAIGPLGTLNAAAGVAVDASGSIWVTNGGDNSVIKFVGLAIPIVTPLAANVGP